LYIQEEQVGMALLYIRYRLERIGKSSLQLNKRNTTAMPLNYFQGDRFIIYGNGAKHGLKL
jgi:hypothetical protein